VDLEESLGLWKEDRAAAQRRLHIFRDLAGFDRLLNQPSESLEGAIQAYAAGASMPSPLLRAANGFNGPPRREDRCGDVQARPDRRQDLVRPAQKESVQADERRP